MTVHLHCVESFEGLSYSDIGERGVEVNCEKNTIFNEHPVSAAFLDNDWRCVQSGTGIGKWSISSLGHQPFSLSCCEISRTK